MAEELSTRLNSLQDVKESNHVKDEQEPLKPRKRKKHKNEPNYERKVGKHREKTILETLDETETEKESSSEEQQGIISGVIALPYHAMKCS